MDELMEAVWVVYPDLDTRGASQMANAYEEEIEAKTPADWALRVQSVLREGAQVRARATAGAATAPPAGAATAPPAGAATAPPAGAATGAGCIVPVWDDEHPHPSWRPWYMRDAQPPRR